ncbi:MAG: hypothetical protein V4692_13345 [Bdellovibrionota bacterium]
MPTTENDRRNQQQPILENPSLPDHDRRSDPGMHTAIPEESREQENIDVDAELTDDLELAAPDQEFAQILKSGTASNNGLIPDDPNNWLTSDPERGVQDLDPESRGESLPDIMDGDKH